MPTNKKLTDFSIIKMPQAVYDSLGNVDADKLHVLTKDDSDTNLEVYSTQRIDEIVSETVDGVTTEATSSKKGLMSAADKAKLDKIADEANKYVHPSHTAATAGFYKVTVDALGHVTAVTKVAKEDITGLGIPGSDTTYNDATTSVAGLMSATDKAKLDKIAEEANKYVLPVAGSSLGGVKTGGDVTIDSNGVISVNDDSHNHVISNVDGLQSALDAKAPLASPALTGTPSAPTATAGTNTTQVATTAFVQTAINNVLEASSAMTFEGTIGTGGTITALPAAHTQGDTYVVITAGTYAGQKCEAGDMIVCNTSGTTANNAHWTVIQANIDGAITGSDTSTLTTSNTVAIFDGTNNRVVKSSGFTIGKSVPADAKFSDTVYTHPSHTAAAAGFYKVTVDALGHVTATTNVTKSDITGLGIPGSDTTYNNATSSVAGLMSANDKAKLDGITAQASSTTIITYTSADIK